MARQIFNDFKVKVYMMDSRRNRYITICPFKPRKNGLKKEKHCAATNATFPIMRHESIAVLNIEGSN